MAIGGGKISFQTPVIRDGWPATTAGDAQLDDAQYRFGPTSLKTDGTGDYVRTNTTGLEFASGSPFTIECWLRSNGSFNAFNGIVGLGNTHVSSGNSVMLYVNQESVNAKVWFTYGFNLIIAGNTALSTNTWTHAAAQRYANNLCELYVDGVLQDTTSTQARTLGQNTGGYISIFTDGTAGPFNGWVDEVRISNIARYSGSSFTLQTQPFENDLNTLYLFHMDGADGSTNIVDDNR